MKLTENQPSDPGFYWAVENRDDAAPEVVRVERKWDKSLFVSSTGWECPLPMDSFRLWSEKLQEPELESA